MSVRRSLISLALLAGATAAALGCEGPSPFEPGLPMPVMAKDGGGGGGGGGGGAGGTPTTSTGLVKCSQLRDSVTQVIGPAGGMIAVGPHILWVDTMALSSVVTITAVAPSDTVRRVRLQPAGLVFRTNGAGSSAVLYTSYKDCGVPTSTTPRIAQVTDSLSIMEYVQGYIVKSRKNPWSQANQYVAGVLDHFSNYAIAW